MKVLLTGSHGLIGSALTPALAADGHRVIRLVRGSALSEKARLAPSGPAPEMARQARPLRTVQ